jgi:uncharacterized lipoprotein YehR (DUF1307 family)
MKSTKKIIIAVLALIAAISLVACGGGDSPGDSNPANSGNGNLSNSGDNIPNASDDDDENNSPENNNTENIVYFRTDIAVYQGNEYTYDTVIALNREDGTFILDFNMLEGFDIINGTFTESETEFVVSGENGRAQFTLEKMPDGNCVVRGEELQYYWMEDGDTLLKITEAQFDEIVKFHAEWNQQALRNWLEEQQREQSSDDIIHEAYRAAMEAMFWFDMDTMQYDSDIYQEIDGYRFNMAAHDTIKTMDDFKNHLGSLFTEEIINRLFDRGLYRDIDGSLYVLGATRGGDLSKGAETYEIIRENERKIIYRVTVEDRSPEDDITVIGHTVHDMIYEYIDGKWVFSKFETVR